MKLNIFYLLILISIMSFVRADDCNVKGYEDSLKIEVAKTVEGFVKVVESIEDPTCFKNSEIKKDAGSPEKQMASLMNKLSDEEVFTRLIMAEMMASTCPSKEVATGIAWVLKNRVSANSKSKFGMGRGVVFKDYQFRSSTGSCDVAKREIFLCPTKEQYKHYKKLAQEAYKEAFTKNTVNPIPRSTLYFFHKHFDDSVDCAKWKGSTPKWATNENEVLPKNLEVDNSCVRFYKD